MFNGSEVYLAIFVILFEIFIIKFVPAFKGCTYLFFRLRVGSELIYISLSSIIVLVMYETVILSYIFLFFSVNFNCEVQLQKNKYDVFERFISFQLCSCYAGRYCSFVGLANMLICF